MKIGVISDTHDNVSAVKKAMEVFSEQGIETLIHCGDFIAPPVIPFMKGYEVHGVLGNNDGEVEGLKSQFNSLGNNSEIHGKKAQLTINGKSIAVIHGDDMDELNDLIDSGEHDYVLYGHYHIKEIRRENGTTVINPGGHFPTVPEENRNIAVIDTGTDEVEFINVHE